MDDKHGKVRFTCPHCGHEMNGIIGYGPLSVEIFKVRCHLCGLTGRSLESYWDAYHDAWHWNDLVFEKIGRRNKSAD